MASATQQKYPPRTPARTRGAGSRRLVALAARSRVGRRLRPERAGPLLAPLLALSRDLVLQHRLDLLGAHAQLQAVRSRLDLIGRDEDRGGS